MTIEHAEELKATYLHAFDSFATEPSEVADILGANSRFARELLGTLTNAHLLTIAEDGDGKDVWQVADPGTYDDHTRDEAVAVIDKFLGTNNQPPKKASNKMTATATKPEVKPPAEVHPCYCGCGENVPSKSFYRPGHDARHAGVIGREVAATGNTDLFNDLPSERLVAKAKGIAEKASEKAKPARKPMVEGTVKIGKNEFAARQDADGNVEYMNKDGDWKAAPKNAVKSFTADTSE